MEIHLKHLAGECVAEQIILISVWSFAPEQIVESRTVCPKSCLIRAQMQY